MSVLPRRSEGVIDAPFGAGRVVYDLVTETRHRLNAAAGAVLDGCDGTTDRQNQAATWVEGTGLTRSVVDDRIDAALTQFEDLGLVGRSTAWQVPRQRTGLGPTSSPRVAHGRRHRLLDLVVRFRGTDVDLLEEIDRYLGTGVGEPLGPGCHPVEPGADLIFEVLRRADGSVELWTDEEVWHDATPTLLRRLVAETTAYAVTTHGCAALHAGGVRSPCGHIVVLPAPSDNGKSTLVAAFVAAGWDYLGDEAIGVAPRQVALGFPRRLRLDPVSRHTVGLAHSPDRNTDPVEIRSDVKRLGGEVGPIRAVVFPTYDPDRPPVIEAVDRHEFLDALLANTLNLARVGQPGLEALCELAESVPAYRIVHGDSGAAVSTVTELLRSL